MSLESPRYVNIGQEGGGCPRAPTVPEATFDDAYYSGGPGSGSLVVCGPNPNSAPDGATLSRFGFTAGDVLNTTPAL